MNIPFNQMATVGNEEKYLLESLKSGHWCGRGPMTKKFEKTVQEKLKVKHAFFVTSCSSALEASCLAAGVGYGDEVVVPSFGFVSAANAVLLAGGKPVFADIDPLTWNITVETVKAAITAKTKAIISVHYAASSAGVEELREFCKDRGLFFIEDAAQSLGAKRRGEYVGPTPWTACFSLHETKNVSCGEGGLVVTDSDSVAEEIEIIIEKGTDRQKFFKGEVDKYTWVKRGASYIASDLLAAVALGQFECLDEITKKRKSIFEIYKTELSDFKNKIQWQTVPEGINPNGHIAAFRVPARYRDEVLTQLKKNGVAAVFHYVPLHNAPFAIENGLLPIHELAESIKLSESLIRLPVYFNLTEIEADRVAKAVKKVLAATMPA